MKYFDKLSAAVQAAFSVRAVDTDKLLYCVKADMDGEGCYYDTYITFDNKTLYLLSGYDRLVKNKKTFDTQFDFKDFSEYPMEEIEKLYVDRYQFTARLMAKMTDGTEKQLTSKEFGILSFLMDHPDEIHTAEEIYENVWKEEPFRCRSIICVHICHIREKLESSHSEKILDSFWKRGYRFNSAS